MNYTCRMDFEWGEAKSDACFQERGFDFAYAARHFLTPVESYSQIPGTATGKTATNLWAPSSIVCS